MKLSEAQMEELARVIGVSAYNAYSATLVGNSAPITKNFSKRLQDIQVGDWVVEITTILMSLPGARIHRPALDAVGVLLRTTQEKVDFSKSDPDFVWDEAVEGRPHPTERCTYIKTIDDREFCWTNARFISVPSEWSMFTGLRALQGGKDG